jgi:mono/diheme cytochrome c family protein
MIGGHDALSAEASVGSDTFRDVRCAARHGENGEGGVGPALPGPTEEQVFRQMRTPLGDVILPFPDTILSDEDVRNISAWRTVPSGTEMRSTGLRGRPSLRLEPRWYFE